MYLIDILGSVNTSCSEALWLAINYITNAILRNTIITIIFETKRKHVE